jgi:hypothetical protein
MAVPFQAQSLDGLDRAQAGLGPPGEFFGALVARLCRRRQRQTEASGSPPWRMISRA